MLLKAYQNEQPDLKAGDMAATLLSGYLQAARPRDVAQELQARKNLGVIYLRQKKWPEAKAALETTHLKLPPEAARRSSDYVHIQALLKKLEAVTAN